MRADDILMHLEQHVRYDEFLVLQVPHNLSGAPLGDWEDAAGMMEAYHMAAVNFQLAQVPPDADCQSGCKFSWACSALAQPSCSRHHALHLCFVCS
jgi:hypothetical protein